MAAATWRCCRDGDGVGNVGGGNEALWSHRRRRQRRSRRQQGAVIVTVAEMVKVATATACRGATERYEAVPAVVVATVVVVTVTMEC